MNQACDVVIVGTGVAGLYCALNLPEKLNVRIITKQAADGANSFLAQGGICVLRGEEDFNDYYEDTMRAGHFENNPKTVELVLRSSNQIIRDLLRLGVRFNRDAHGNFDYTREGAHSRPRILFCNDVTGREITGTLLQQVRSRPNVTIDEYTTMVDILSKDNNCLGVVVADREGKISAIGANHVVLACGGLGGLYKNSTSFPHITGDALAIALRHNIAVEHLDYVQIHPTTLFSNKPGRRFLISESVRGEGALLLDKRGNRFVDELQPRDVVSQAIWKQMEIDQSEHVWEDMRPLGEQTILTHFPHIYRRCLEEGFDPRYTPIPVVPAQHYLMGGIKVDLASRTSMAGLYACGETSCNGIHGKNRLASNSLLESLVFAQRAADDIVFAARTRHTASLPEVDLEQYQNLDALFDDYRKNILNRIERLEVKHG
ncbi:L-aspartate oxidase [Luoshenia tenuis]|jgi:L-aspartate oxidase|uniref:L-aspartate oxidase n=1 Tax=Luoshenia tenuis TaxID=2763654 RepID=UPI003D8B169E